MGHAPYIEEVRRLLESRDLVVTVVSATSRGGRREAVLLLHPDRAAFAEPVTGDASLTWDEENGWSLTTRPDPGMLGGAAPFSRASRCCPTRRMLRRGWWSCSPTPS